MYENRLNKMQKKGEKMRGVDELEKHKRDRDRRKREDKRTERDLSLCPNAIFVNPNVPIFFAQYASLQKVLTSEFLMYILYII